MNALEFLNGVVIGVVIGCLYFVLLNWYSDDDS